MHNEIRLNSRSVTRHQINGKINISTGAKKPARRTNFELASGRRGYLSRPRKFHRDKVTPTITLVIARAYIGPVTRRQFFFAGNHSRRSGPAARTRNARPRARVKIGACSGEGREIINSARNYGGAAHAWPRNE